MCTVMMFMLTIMLLIITIISTIITMAAIIQSHVNNIIYTDPYESLEWSIGVCLL